MSLHFDARHHYWHAFWPLLLMIPYIVWLGFRIPIDVSLKQGNRDGFSAPGPCIRCHRQRPRTFLHCEGGRICWECISDTLRVVRKRRIIEPRPFLPPCPREVTGTGPTLDERVWGAIA